jgi:DNA polymerase elongation subunit (family B)
LQNQYVLVSAFYDGKLKRVGLKFYDTLSRTIKIVHDSSGFMPYFISTAPVEELEALKGKRNDIARLEPVTLFDSIADKPVVATKVVVTDPLAISGGDEGKPGLRDMVDAHEADIKTYLNYLYDNSLIPGTYFDEEDHKLVPSVFSRSESATKLLEKVISTPGLTDDAKNVFTEWVSLFDQPLPTFRLLALDIEVWNERMYKVPNIDVADMPVVSVSLVGDDGVKEVHVFARGVDQLSMPGASVITHPSERSLLSAVFERIEQFPFIVTFNGDQFDLPYLHNRARALGLDTPFRIRRGKSGKGGEAALKNGVHIDLYKFHSNKSVQLYIYEGVYHEFTLDAICQALLGERKIEIPTKGDISALTYDQLLEYSLQDSVLTYRLASRRDQLSFKLMVLFSRTSMLPMDDVSRHGISTWIKSMMSYQMRKRNVLIPDKKDLSSKGGASTQATIKGKQYQGAIVVDPLPGIYFNITVLDFASLYPTSVKNRNLSFESVNCPHPECKNNIIPGTNHWSCLKKQGITALLVGTLRDLRVSFYKPLAKVAPTEADRELANTVAQSLKVYLNACFTGDTDVMTPTGVKNIKEFAVGDQVISVNPKTLAAEIDRVVETQDYSYHGKLFSFNNGSSVDLMVTPNHKFLVNRGTRTEFSEAKTIYSEGGAVIPAAKLPLAGECAMKETATATLAKSITIGPGHIKEVDYYGRVYCITTERNHTVVAGRNGRLSLTSQSYGVMGYDKFGLYCLPVAEATAALGRYATSQAIDKCKKIGLKIVGGDTDSLFLDTPSQEKVAEIISWAHSKLNLDLEVDKTFRLALFTSRKKNYFGVLPDDKIVIKGLSGKKSHSPQYIRNAFKAVIDEIATIRSPTDIEPTKVRLMDMLKQYYAKLCDKSAPIKDLAVHMKMKGSVESYTKNTPQHVQAAKWLIEAGREVNEGDTVTFVKVKPQKLKKLDDSGTEIQEDASELVETEPSKAEKKAKTAKVTAKPLEFVRGDEINYEKYKDMFISTFEQVFDALGIQLSDEVLAPKKEKKASTLDAF